MIITIQLENDAHTEGYGSISAKLPDALVPSFIGIESTLINIQFSADMLIDVGFGCFRNYKIEMKEIEK